MKEQQPSPPPPAGLSRVGGMVERMYGGTAQQWLSDLGDLADAAALDPAMCVAVVQALRAVRNELLVSEALHQCQQDSTLLPGVVGISNDGGFWVWNLGGADGQPPQVA
jgi:hypothetical protein